MCEQTTELAVRDRAVWNTAAATPAALSELIEIVSDNCVPTSQKTHCISVTNIDLLMFAVTVVVNCKNGTEHINAVFRFLPHIAKLGLLMCSETHCSL